MLSFKTIRKVMLGSTVADEHLATYIERLNANIGVYAGSWLAILEAFMLAGSVMRGAGYFSMAKALTYVVFGIMSAALSVVSHQMLKHKVDRGVFTGFLTVYMYVVAAYAIANTVDDFADGEQCFTFLVFMMVDVCIFATPPLGSFILVLLSYVTLYGLAFSGGRLDAGSLASFCVSFVVVLMAGYVRFRECRIGAERERELERVGSRDGVTGLKNRMALRTDFPTLVGRDQYVVMADLDDFKGVNDTYGHDAGDKVLSTYGAALTTCVPRADIYRYGGDEFLFFVPRDSIESMDERMAELRERIGVVTCADGQTVMAGTSVGWVVGKASDEAELRAQVREADERLYEDKTLRRKGRTRAT